MNFILIFTVILINGFGELRILPILPVDHSHNNSAVENDSKFKEKDFSYLLGNVNGIHDDLLKMHFTLYRGYVKNSNLLSEMLENLRKDGKDKSPVFGALKRRFGWEYDGMFLHELYFKNLGKPVSLNPKSDLYQKIVQDFGSFEKWLNDFKSTGLIR